MTTHAVQTHGHHTSATTRKEWVEQIDRFFESSTIGKVLSVHHQTVKTLCQAVLAIRQTAVSSTKKSTDDSSTLKTQQIVLGCLLVVGGAATLASPLLGGTDAITKGIGQLSDATNTIGNSFTTQKSSECTFDQQTLVPGQHQALQTTLSEITRAIDAEQQMQQAYNKSNV